MSANMRTRVARVMALARETGSPKPSATASYIRGAIDDSFERFAQDLLEGTEAKRAEMGLTEQVHEKEVATYLQFMTAQALTLNGGP